MAGCDHFSQSPQNERFHLIFRDFSELLGPLTRNRASFISRCLGTEVHTKRNPFRIRIWARKGAWHAICPIEDQDLNPSSSFRAPPELFELTFSKAAAI